MKKVWLLGDSIRLIGYGPRMQALLGDEYEVHQSEDNGRFAKYTLRFLFDFREDMKNTDIIHWNNGLWDTSTGLFDDGLPFTCEAEYVENMLRIARQLKKITPHVIFATTTPVNNPDAKRDYEIIKTYNALVVPELEKMGVVINDLHRTVDSNKDLYICSDTLHLSEEGVNVCAEQVAECIRNVLK